MRGPRPPHSARRKAVLEVEFLHSALKYPGKNVRINSRSGRSILNPGLK